MKQVRTKSRRLFVQIWERLQLAIGEAEKEGVYSCRVTDIKRRALVITRPQYEYGHSLMAGNRVVSARFTRADAAYSFRARLVEMSPKSLDGMYLTDIGPIERVQRRRFVRLDMIIPVAYNTLPNPITEEINLSSTRFRETMTINLSAGGMALKADERIDPDSLLMVRFRERKLVNLPAYLLAVCRQARVLERDKWTTGVEFILVEDLSRYLPRPETELIPERARRFDQRVQNALVSELFTEQLSLRQKGII